MRRSLEQRYGFHNPCTWLPASDAITGAEAASG